MRYTNPINAGILGAAAPVVVAVLGAVWLRDRLSAWNLGGIVLTVVAVLLTLSHGSPERLATLAFNRGDLLILTSEIGWISYTLYSRALTSRLQPVTVLAGAHVISTLVLAPLVLLVEGGGPWRRRAGRAGPSSSTAPSRSRSAISGTTRPSAPSARDARRSSPTSCPSWSSACPGPSWAKRSTGITWSAPAW
jgi:hypothetical protein